MGLTREGLTGWQSSVRMKLIVSQVIASLRGTAMDYAKIAKLTSDAGFEPSEIKVRCNSLFNQRLLCWSNALHVVLARALRDQGTFRFEPYEVEVRSTVLLLLAVCQRWQPR